MASPTNASQPAGTGKMAADKMQTSTVPKGKVDQDKKSLASSASGDHPGSPQRYALGIASVVRVDYESHMMDIRSETGETFQYRTPITQAGAGPRRFFGSMPEVGDTCVVGYAPGPGLRPGGVRQDTQALRPGVAANGHGLWT